MKTRIKTCTCMIKNVWKMYGKSVNEWGPSFMEWSTWAWSKMYGKKVNDQTSTTNISQVFLEMVGHPCSWLSPKTLGFDPEEGPCSVASPGCVLWQGLTLAPRMQWIFGVDMSNQQGYCWGWDEKQASSKSLNCQQWLWKLLGVRVPVVGATFNSYPSAIPKTWFLPCPDD